MYLEAKVEYLQYLLYGAVISFLVSIGGCTIGIPLGLLIAMGRVKRIPILAPMLALYVSFIRSLPLLLFVMLFYFGLPVFGIDLNAYVASIITLALNNAAFTSEIWRAAIMDFASEQLEAAKSVGMTDNQAFWRITLPQIWRASLPAFTNEVTLLIKATPAVGIIGIDDLTRRAGKLAASNYDPLRMISLAMIMYVVVLFVLSRASRAVDQHLQRRYELI